MDHLTIWHLVALALGTAILTSAILGGVGAWIYVHRIRPEKARLEEKIAHLGGELEDSIERGIRRGVRKAVAELPQNAARQTTQSVTRMGADLVERGLSSLIERPVRQRKDAE
ncbi:hypothetical protein AAIA72_02845 [Hahella sp. SMD15-11]|uniref:DUF948 domain-containing protein n=1 Tax=Thermohahella caldifontis TaxID=3142973 RepID=A0AB39UY21_9GAMM